MAVKKNLTKEEVITNPVFEDENTFTFLAGYTDSEGVTHKTFTLREPNGKDEEAMQKDSKVNPCKSVTTLLSRVCLSIGSLTRESVGGMQKWESIIRDLYVGDVDYMLYCLRRLSFGDTIEVSHQCPECKSKLDTEIGLDEIEIVPYKGSSLISFSLPKGYKDSDGVIHKEGKIRLSKQLDREILYPIIKKGNLAKVNTMMLTRLISFDDGQYVDNDVVSHLVSRDRSYLDLILKENLFGVNPECEIICPDCGNEFTATLNVLNFI